MSAYARLAIVLTVVLAATGAWWKLDCMLAAADQRGYDRAIQEQTTKALAESQAKAKETFRRLEAQDENQRAQDAELVAARAAAARNAADADRVRHQAADAAREWAERLADSPSREDLAAAGAALRVCTDLLGRSDARAGLLARVADARHAAGLKCERDYDALSQRTAP